MNLLSSAMLNLNPVPLIPAAADNQSLSTGVSFAEVAAIEGKRIHEKPPAEQMQEEPQARDPVEEFKEYMDLPPAEKMRYNVLAEEDLTMEEYNKLPPEEKAKVDEIINERLSEYRAVREVARSQPQAVAQYQLMQLDSFNDSRPKPSTDVFI